MVMTAPPDDQQETARTSGIAYGAAFTLFTSVAAFLGIGYLIDRWLGTQPWFLVGGIVIGAAAGFYQFVRITSKLS